MTSIKTSSVFVALALVLTLVACAPGSKSEPQGEQSAPAVDTSEPVAAPAAQEVTYEPAYPEEVSEEGLTDEDVEQQEAGHSHGPGADHTHDDEPNPDGNDDKHPR